MKIKIISISNTQYERMKSESVTNQHKELLDVVSVVGAVRVDNYIVTDEGIELELKRRGYKNYKEKAKQFLEFLKKRKHVWN